MSPVAARTFLCAACGTAVGVLLIAWVTVVRILGGADAFTQDHVTYAAAVGFYLVSGALGGAVVGALLPLGRRLFGAIFLGSIVGTGIFAAGFTVSGGLNLFAAVLCGVLLGGTIGYMAWNQLHGEG